MTKQITKLHPISTFIGSFLFLALLLANSDPSIASMRIQFDTTTVSRTDTIKVRDIRCGQCESRIHRAFKGTKGISDLYANVETGSVVVSYNPSEITRDAIEEIIAKTGYGVGKRVGDPVARKALPSCCR